jgi:ubiquinol-cytochrome c reductase iron-sulfur subunit
MTTPTTTGTEPVRAEEPAELDVHDPRLTRFDLVREGARRDGIEIVLYEPRFPPGSRAERRVERTIAALFLLAGLAATAFVVAYIWWPWEYEGGSDTLSRYYTPVLGVTLGLSLFAIGAAITTWVKKLMPHEVAIEQRHDGPASSADQKLMVATLAGAVDDSGIKRRPLLKGALALGLAPLGIVAAAPLVGGLIKNPHAKVDPVGQSALTFTGFNRELNNGQPVRLVRQDGTPIRPADVSPGGQLTVFPGVPGGATNQYPNAPTLLIHLREEDAQQLRETLYEMNQGSMAGNFVAYSKICTHAGCPPSLYEQETNRLLCPCHQSQFLITDNARPVFGPAARSLPMLPIELDNEGFFVATRDYKVPVGPSFWER